MQRSTARRAGFTLIELLVVVVVISILLGILFPVIGEMKVRSFRTQTQRTIDSLYVSLAGFFNEHGYYPAPEPFPGSLGPGDELQMWEEGCWITRGDSGSGSVMSPDFRTYFSVDESQLGPDAELLDAFGEPLRYMYSPDAFEVQLNETYNLCDTVYNSAVADTSYFCTAADTSAQLVDKPDAPIDNDQATAEVDTDDANYSWLAYRTPADTAGDPLEIHDTIFIYSKGADVSEDREKAHWSGAANDPDDPWETLTDHPNHDNLYRKATR
jgi:prepilin-type N-terminal cleavage/methylation domain-containing protein